MYTIKTNGRLNPQRLSLFFNRKRRALTSQRKPDTSFSPPANMFEEGFLASLHKPGENPQIDEKLRVAHLKATGGKVITRFPPERHAKAIVVYFGDAKYHGGLCYLRYDDTNPSKEEQLFFDNILTVIRWLGIEPDKVIYSSDYFDILFNKAVELIKKDKAYVFEERGQTRGSRGVESHQECVHRRRPINESLAMFDQMKDGHPDVANATLRMKQDLTDPNPQMWDLLAYRSYSDPHPLNHSLCTSEFVASRQSYEWLCHSLEVYTPRQYEYGRLSLTHTVMSKRRLHRLVQGGRVTIAFRRRGVPPEAIMNFVRGLGVTTAMAVTDLAKFDESIRKYLEPLTPRLFLILRPITVVIENLADEFLMMVEKLYHPKNPNMGTGSVPFTRRIYIDADDFRVSGSKDYHRLVPGGSVGLLHVPYPITCTSFQTDDEGNVRIITAHYDDAQPVVKPKAFIHWIAECPSHQSPVRVQEARLVGPLFKSPNPPDDEEIAGNSLDVRSSALIKVGFWEIAKAGMRTAREAARSRISAPTPPGISPITEDQLVGPECVRFQATRVGYFALDGDSNIPTLRFGPPVGTADPKSQVIVLNRIVSLKDGDSKFAK
ncbi:hypothetical protein C8R44DRAFT_835003 [Mycena epipterygia]|nr:hypothetical protein C8R44DRAFT_835003 [Mycena epipterygia]